MEGARDTVGQLCRVRGVALRIGESIEGAVRDIEDEDTDVGVIENS
jgi:hypothetical protein